MTTTRMKSLALLLCLFTASLALQRQTSLIISRQQCHHNRPQFAYQLSASGSTTDLSRRSNSGGAGGEDENKTGGAPRKGGQRAMIAGSGKAINTEILTIFSDRSTSSTDKVAALNALLLGKNAALLNHVHAATLLQRCARAKIDITKVVPLQTIGAMLARTSHRDHLRAVEAAHALYGLRVLSLDTPDMTTYLNLVADLALECSEEFKGQEIGNAMFGLQRLGSDSPDVRRLLAILAVKFKLSKTTMTSQECSNALYGMRRMTSDSTDALAMLDVLTEKVLTCKDPFNAQCIGNIMNGLQGMSSDHAPVVAFLRAIIPKIAQSQSELNAIHIGSALMGLKSMTADVEEVRTIIALLAVKINDTPVTLDPVSLSSAMNGMRNLKDEGLEVRALLSTLAEKIGMMRERELEPKIIANALYGMRRMTGQSPECKQVLAALLSKMSPPLSSATFTSLEFGRAFNGLQSMSVDTCPDVKVLLGRLADQLVKSPDTLLARDVGLTLAGLRAQTEFTAEVRAVLSAVAAKLALSSDVLNCQSASMAMVGLQRMSSSCVEVRQVLTSLGPRIASVDHPLDAQACANILFSLKKMTSDEAEVRAFLAAIAPRLEASRGLMNAQELANAYYGMNGMDSCHAEVRNVLRILNGKLAAITAAMAAAGGGVVDGGEGGRSGVLNMRFTSQGVGNALSGFQSMVGSDGPEPLEAMSLLVEHIESCVDVMSPMDLSNALFGLQGMTSEYEEVRAVLIALVEKMRQSDGIYSARDIGYSLAGLSAMGEPIVHDEVRALFEELCVKVSRSEFQGQPNLLFLQFGKGIRVKRGQPFSLSNAENLSGRKADAADGGSGSGSGNSNRGSSKGETKR